MVFDPCRLLEGQTERVGKWGNSHGKAVSAKGAPGILLGMYMNERKQNYPSSVFCQNTYEV